MKTLLLLITLLAFTAAGAQSIYYGGSIGVGAGKTLSNKTGLPGTHINDLYLSVPVGCIIARNSTGGGIIAELEPLGTAAMNFQASATAGFKQDFSEHAGVHILFGVTDMFLYSPRPAQVTQHFYPEAKARLWIGNFMAQAAYIHAPTSAGTGQFYAGIGVVGLWEKL
jgi:hypothetical protein